MRARRAFRGSGPRRYKRAKPASSNDEPLLCEYVEGAFTGDATDAVLHGKLLLGRDLVAWDPFAGVDFSGDVLVDLFV